MDDLDTAPTRDYLLKGLMSPNEISVWVGAPKCGKTFLILDIAYRLSLGLPVFGRRVKPARVLYVAAEGEGGIGNRIKALRNRYGKSPNFRWIAQPADLLHEHGHVPELTAASTEHGANLIIGHLEPDVGRRRRERAQRHGNVHRQRYGRAPCQLAIHLRAICRRPPGHPQVLHGPLGLLARGFVPVR
jgi:hypothetical protein